MKNILFLISLFIYSFVYSQTKKINYEAEIQEANEEKYPGASILIGNVKMIHDGIILTSQQALFYKEKNFFKAIGKVIIKQGDTITQTSNYTDYDANSKQALSWGNVVLKDPTMTLTADTLHFDRLNQKLYYKSYATIKDSTNTLKSKNGNFYLETKKFTATTRVTVVNPEHHLASNHLDYYTNSGLTYLYGPSTITNTENDNKMYCERGFYNTKTDISYFVKKANHNHPHHPNDQPDHHEHPNFHSYHKANHNHPHDYNHEYPDHHPNYHHSVLIRCAPPPVRVHR